MTLRNPTAPRLINAPQVVDGRYMDQLLGILRIYFSQLDNYHAALSNGGPFDFIDFDQQAVYSNQASRVGWNSTDQTLNIGMQYGVVQQVGMETFARVENATGVDIANGTTVGFAGVGPNGVLSVEPYIADGSHTSLNILGVVTHDLPDTGSVGYCTVFGHVNDVDTTGSVYGETWAIGDVLYANPLVAGGLTNVKPTAPSNVIPVAAVLVVHATTGKLFVRPTVDQMQYYGVFNKTTNQSPAVVNTEYLLTIDTEQVGNGVVIGTPASRIVVPQSGLYQFDATVQATSSSASAKTLWVWFKVNGVSVANSARILTMDINSGYLPLTLGQAFSLEASDYVELAFASDSTAISVSTVAATAFAPAAPAVILNVTQVQQ